MGEAAMMGKEINKGNPIEGLSTNVAVVAQTVSEMIDKGKLKFQRVKNNLQDSPLKQLNKLGIDTSILTAENIRRTVASPFLQERLREETNSLRSQIDNLALKTGVTRDKIITDAQVAIAAMSVSPASLKAAEAAMLLAPALADLLPVTAAGRPEGMSAIVLMNVFDSLRNWRKKKPEPSSMPAPSAPAPEGPVEELAPPMPASTTALPELNAGIEISSLSAPAPSAPAPEEPKGKPSKGERWKNWKKKNIWLEDGKPKTSNTPPPPLRTGDVTSLPELDSGIQSMRQKSHKQQGHGGGSSSPHRLRNLLGSCGVIGVAAIACLGVAGISYLRGGVIAQETPSPESIPTPTRVPEDIDRQITHSIEAKNFLKAYQDGKLKVNPLDLDSSVVKNQIAYNNWDWWKSEDGDLLKRAFGDKLTPTEVDSLRVNPNNLFGLLQKKALDTEGPNVKYWQRLYRIYSARKNFIGSPEEFLKQMDKLTNDEISQLMKSLNSESLMLRSGAYEGPRGNFGNTGLPKTEVLQRNKAASQAAKRIS